LNYLRASLMDDFLDAADDSTDQANLDPMGMLRRAGQNILDDPLGQFSGTLILFSHHSDMRSLFNVFSVCSVHAPTH